MFVSRRIRIAPLEVRQDIVREGCIEVRRDRDPPLVEIERVGHRPRSSDRDQPGERFPGLGDDDFLSSGNAGQQPGVLASCTFTIFAIAISVASPVD
jgi:hypothetical protein